MARTTVRPYLGAQVVAFQGRGCQLLRLDAASGDTDPATPSTTKKAPNRPNMLASRHDRHVHSPSDVVLHTSSAVDHDSGGTRATRDARHPRPKRQAGN